MKKLIVLLMVVSLVSVASADALRYIGSGDWMNAANWGGCSLPPCLPGSDDSVRINWGNNTVTLAATAPDIASLQIGVDESGNLIINAGGSLTMLDNSKVGNNGICTGTLTVDAGGTVNFNGGWMMIAGNSDVIGDVDVTGTMSTAGHLWMATGAGSIATLDIYNGGVVNVGGMLGLGTINGTSASGGTATITIHEGGTLNLSNILPGGTSIWPGSLLDITGTGIVTLPGDFEAVIAAYAAAGKIAGNGIPGAVQTDTTTNPGYTTVTAVVPVCIAPPTMDTNDDCRIDIIDFAVFALEWLTCGLDIQLACW